MTTNDYILFVVVGLEGFYSVYRNRCRMETLPGVLFQQSEKSGYFMFINTRSEDFFWYCGYASDLSSGSKVSSLQQQHFEYLKKFFHEIILERKV